MYGKVSRSTFAGYLVMEDYSSLKDTIVNLMHYIGAHTLEEITMQCPEAELHKLYVETVEHNYRE